MISVIVPTRNNSPDLEGCLKSLKNQKERPKEVITVFGDEADGNIHMAKKYNARIVVDSNGTIGSAYAAGVKAALGDIVAFIDDDCTALKGWTGMISREFGTSTDVLGGDDLLPEKSSFFQRAVYQIDKSRMVKKTLYGADAKKRLRAANIAYRKKVFEKENFNSSLIGLQEPEFHHRLYKRGFRMKFSPGLYVYHKRRNSLKGVFFQIYRNGKAKMDVLKIHGDTLSGYDVLPFAYVVLLLFAVLMASGGGIWYSQMLFYATAAYFLVKPLAIVAKTLEFVYYPHLVAVVAIREVAYSLGVFAGVPRIFRTGV